jgi:putative IMPACT (imprinted ancient) family translation regulator
MSLSNIEKINDHFKLPIFYNEERMELNKNITTDLELIKAVDPSGCNPLYYYAFQPKSEFAEKVIEQIPNYYTTDVTFLKDTQKLVSTLSTFGKSGAKNNNNFGEKEGFCTTFSKSCKSSMIEIWDEIKNDTGFKERYHYIDWPMWEYLNKSDYFLQILSVYNLAAPVVSLLVPFIILIIPFFVIKAKGLTVTVNEYIEILKTIATNHAIGKLFTKFHTVKLDEKIYILLSAAFYVFSIYQNILTCWRFNDNMIKIHSHLEKIRKYVEETEQTMYKFLLDSSNLSSYDKFNAVLKQKLGVLVQLKKELERISPYKLSYSKVGELGHVLKCFYDIYSNLEYNDAFLYSFGFNGYIECISGLSENVKNGNIKISKFNAKKKSNVIKKAYYPALINNKPIKNSFKFKKNMIITGPNASGKTTSLKTALINVIISQQFGCGFYESADINPYKHIHCYLNIPDTSGRDSLFQAEARRCKEILDVIQRNDKKETHFCVFDELYSGTNPDEAVSSAHAFMKYLIKYKTVNCILTTHFIDLCKKLDTNESIENYQMKTVCCDKTTGNDFNYTYLLEKGISNVRGGVKVLHDMNYPKEIIEDTIKTASA